MIKKKNDTRSDLTFQLASVYLGKRTWPLITFWTSMFMATLVDSILVSNYYGSDGLTIVSVYAPIITIWWIFAAGLGVAGSAMFAKLQGNNQQKDAQRLASDFNGITLILALALGVLGLAVLPGLSRFLVADNPEILPAALQFGLWTMLTTPFMIYCSVLSDFVHADNAPKLAMISIVVQNVVNIVLDVVFMGVFDFGPQGASLALFIGTIAALGVILSHYRRNDCTMRFKFSLPKLKTYPKIIKYSYSAMLASTYDAITLILLNKLALDTFGLEMATVFFMTTYTVYLTRGPYVGISSAVMPVQTAFLGGGNNRGAKIATILSIRTCILLVSAMIVVLLIFPNVITTLYSFNYEHLLDESAFAIRIVAVSLLFRAVNYIMYTSYIGVGHSGFSLLISSLRSVVMPVAVGIWAAYTENFTLFLSGALLAEASTMLLWLVLAKLIERRKNLDSILLLPKTNTIYKDKLELLLVPKNNEIRLYKEHLEDFLTRNDLPLARIQYSKLALEELVLYCTSSAGFKKNDYIYADVMILDDDKIRMIVRFCADATKVIDCIRSSEDVEDDYVGLRYLYNKSESFVYNRVLGLNNIDITY